VSPARFVQWDEAGAYGRYGFASPQSVEHKNMFWINNILLSPIQDHSRSQSTTADVGQPCHSDLSIPFRMINTQTSHTSKSQIDFQYCRPGGPIRDMSDEPHLHNLPFRKVIGSSFPQTGLCLLTSKDTLTMEPKLLAQELEITDRAHYRYVTNLVTPRILPEGVLNFVR
jgi:hypothetical protein